ncbi:MAG: DUF1080 domain-containing protein [Candidatus Eisenbacteria bacterium]|nr:DUF1080 domain-containing protein [Candidatus Eisenbacteria bacterium]
MGRWDVTVCGQDGCWPSWFELTRGRGGLAMRFVSRVGGARPIQRLEVYGNELRFAVPPWMEDPRPDPLFHGRFNGRWFTGTAKDEQGYDLNWSAVRAPALARAGVPRWGAPIELFDGRDLAGWRPRYAGQPPGWRVQDGLLTAGPGAGDILTTRRFRDFRLHVEFRLDRDTDSGIYLRGRHEIQVSNVPGRESESGRNGSLYSLIPPAADALLPPGEWQSYDIALVGRRLTVVLNGTTLIAEQEMPGITGGALDSDEAAPGPLMLQGFLGQVAFRKLVLTPAR